MNILISGGTGFLGSAFSQWLYEDKNKNANITWLSRDSSQKHPSYVTMMSYDELQTTDKTFDVILNLAGAGIADKRWSAERKQLLMNSRLNPTQAIMSFIARTAQRPKLLVSGSAIGWYGARGDTPLDETSLPPARPKEDFAHQLCAAWEAEASIATGLGVEVAIVRTGIVIHPDGGMVDRLLLPFKMGAGGKLGDGSQIMSWISREDWIRATGFIIEHSLTQNANDQGSMSTPDSKPHVYNLTAPNPVSNATFTKAIGEWLNRPTFMTLPEPVLKTLFGEMSTLLVDGQKVLPKALLEAGFEFKHKSLKQALEEQT